jgi:ABC-type multidrug transport system ATPase subunit
MILIDGQIRADGSLDELTSSRIEVVSLATDDPSGAANVFENLPGVGRVERVEGTHGFETFRLHLNEDRQLGEAIFDAVRERGWRLRELRRDDKTLEQVFRELTEAGAEVAA